MVSESIKNQVIALRKAGRTCRETAIEVGCAESTVWSVMRRTGLNGQIRNIRPASRRPAASVEAAVERFGSVYIEEGMNGGYIATLGDEWTGSECATPQSAIRSAATEAIKE